jgi:hypothetical protein
MFTTSFEPLFTNDSDVTGANRATTCVVRRRHAD